MVCPSAKTSSESVSKIFFSSASLEPYSFRISLSLVSYAESTEELRILSLSASVSVIDMESGLIPK